MSQNNPWVSTPSRILLLWNVSVGDQRLHGPACHILQTRVQSHREWGFSLTAKVRPSFHSASAVTSRGNAKIFYMMYVGAVMRAEGTWIQLDHMWLTRLLIVCACIEQPVRCHVLVCRHGCQYIFLAWSHVLCCCVSLMSLKGALTKWDKSIIGNTALH